ncbi:MAG: hypothetical protein DMF79_13460, partial [Acidobacteria bacterium]
MQGEKEREARLLGEEGLEQVERIGKGGERQGDAFVDVRVPEAQLPGAQPLDHEAPQGEELQREVAEVKAVPGQEAPQEGQEGHGQEKKARADVPGAFAHPRERTFRAGT